MTKDIYLFCTDEYGIEWTENYSVWSAYIGGLVRASVYCDNGLYIIKVETKTLKNPAKTPEEGMKRAVLYVKQQFKFLFENKD